MIAGPSSISDGSIEIGGMIPENAREKRARARLSTAASRKSME
jgi:hypothetical protein